MDFTNVNGYRSAWDLIMQRPRIRYDRYKGRKVDAVTERLCRESLRIWKEDGSNERN